MTLRYGSGSYEPDPLFFEEYFMDSFTIGDRYEKVFLLRIMKESRERLALRLVAIEMIDHKSFTKKQVGEQATINTEIDVINRMIDNLWSSILTSPPIPGVVDPTVGNQTERSGTDGDGHPLAFMLDNDPNGVEP